MKKSIYHTAALVTGLSVAERSLGFLYRVVLSRLIGSEGLGLYQVALSVFSVFMTVGTGGIPITVSRLITKSRADGDKQSESAVCSAGALASLCLTLPVCIFFLLFGKHFGFLFSDERCLNLFFILLIGLVFTCIYAVVRGSFWGNKQFLAPSVLELVEEAVMVIAGVLLIRNATSVYDGAMRAAVAVIISYFVSFTSSVFLFFLRGGKLSNPKPQLKPLFASAMPITAVRAGSSLVGSAVAVLLPIMLVKSGMPNTEALQLFGVVSGMVMPILSIPSTVIGSISLVLVPELSEDFYKKNHTRLSANIERGIFVTTVIACLLIPLFFVLGEDLGRLVYSNETAGTMIRNCCFMLLPMSLTMITTGILNSLGFEKNTLRYYFVGAIFLIVCVLFLPKYIGIYAYPLGLLLSYLATAILNLRYLCRKCPLSKTLLRHCGIAAALTLPSILIGKFAANGLTLRLGAFWAMSATAIIMCAVTLAGYLLFRILPLPRLKKEFFQK